MSRKGIPNKRTVLRQEKMEQAREAAKVASLRGLDPYATADSVEIMEVGMRYCYRRFNEELAVAQRAAIAEAKKKHREPEVNDKIALPYLHDAVSIAEKVAQYRHPKLSSVKVGQDRDNDVRDLTTEDAAARLLRLMDATGKIPKVLQIESTAEEVEAE
jgi:hypothetical protein